MVEFEQVLKASYYSTYTVFNESADIKRDIEDQTTGRLTKFRNEVVPWLASNRKLEGAKILEIGCGTGSSTVAFSEQGALVTALDVDERSLDVARKRVSLFGLSAEFVYGNGQDIHKIFEGKSFDLIVFSATLEHMTYPERIASLKAAYSLMRPDDLLAIIETPNRLWFYDFHTAFLPFYFWLPDELAFDYAGHSKRHNFSEVYTQKTPEQMRHFVRRGRGVSFHEFEIAFDGFDTMKVVSNLEKFRKRKAFQFITDRLKSRGYLRYKNFIRKNGTSYHEGFFEPWLDVIFKKS